MEKQKVRPFKRLIFSHVRRICGRIRALADSPSYEKGDFKNLVGSKAECFSHYPIYFVAQPIDKPR